MLHTRLTHKICKNSPKKTQTQASSKSESSDFLSELYERLKDLCKQLQETTAKLEKAKSDEEKCKF